MRTPAQGRRSYDQIPRQTVGKTTRGIVIVPKKFVAANSYAALWEWLSQCRDFAWYAQHVAAHTTAANYAGDRIKAPADADECSVWRHLGSSMPQVEAWRCYSLPPGGYLTSWFDCWLAIVMVIFNLCPASVVGLVNDLDWLIDRIDALGPLGPLGLQWLTVYFASSSNIDVIIIMHLLPEPELMCNTRITFYPGTLVLEPSMVCAPSHAESRIYSTFELLTQHSEGWLEEIFYSFETIEVAVIKNQYHLIVLLCDLQGETQKTLSSNTN